MKPIEKQRTRRVPWWLLLPAVVMLFSAGAAGCSGRRQSADHRAAVSGTVTYQGKPLRGGSITFISETQPEMRVTCMIQPDGSFSVADAPIGNVLVAVETHSVMLGGDAEHYVPIPEHYAHAGRSGVTYQIQSGENRNVTFHLK